MMKKIIAISMFVMAFSITGMAQFKFGAGISILEGEFGIQGRAFNQFSETIGGQGTFNYYFTDGFTFFAIDADVHYMGVSIGDDAALGFSPFAGLNFAFVDNDFANDSDIGVNLGALFTYVLDSGLQIYAEPKFVLGGDLNGFGLGAGVYF